MAQRLDRIELRSPPSRPNTENQSDADAEEHREEHRFRRSLATDAAQQRMAAFLAAGGQTRDVELNLGALVDALADAPGDS